MYVFTKIGSSFEKTQVPLESVLSVLLFVLPCGLSAQETISLDGEWSFWTPDHPQTTVNVPHTFNVMDGLESYAGKAFYSREVPVGPQQKGKKLRVQFNGVFHDAVVYVNGQKAGEHLNAGYTPFSFDITPFIDYSPGARNEMLVECDNSYSEDNLPCGSRFDWANDGGIYRSVSLHTSGAHSLRYVHVTPQIDLQDSTALAQFSIRLWEPDRPDSVCSSSDVEADPGGDVRRRVRLRKGRIMAFRQSGPIFVPG